MSIVAASYDTMGLVRVICEATIIALIALEPVKNLYLKKFVKCLLVAFIFEEFLLCTQVFVKYMSISDDWRTIIWRTYELIRIFISLSLCYPISLFIGENGQKLQRLFIVAFCLLTMGTMSDHFRYNNGHSGMNHIANMFIFLFTFHQYLQLRRRTEGEIPRLKSLMFLELTLIVLNGILIVLVFNGGYEHKLLPAIKIALGILQYQKFYMMIMVMTYFD